MRRNAPALAALTVCALLGLTGCAGGDAGAATAGAAGGQAAPPPTAPPAPTPGSALARLIVVPEGYVEDRRELSGPFTLATFLGSVSADPAVDRALLLNAGFTEGYQAVRTSQGGKKQFTVQLFKTASAKKARDLQDGFWNQQPHSLKFTVPGIPGVYSDQRVAATGVEDQSESTAQVSFVVGTLLARISVRQIAPVTAAPPPDTKLATTLAIQQHTRLTPKSG